MTTNVYPDDIDYADIRSVLVIGADDAAAGIAADAAIADAGLRSLGRCTFADAAARLALTSPDLILVEAAGAEIDRIDDVLTAIDALARDRDIAVVVAMRADQVDAVTARLFGPHVEPLTDATVLDRVVALGCAGGVRHARLNDSARDADERLRRLNHEVARFAQTLAMLAADRDLPREQVRDVGRGFRAEAPDGVSTATDPAAVRDLIRARRMRAAYFPEGLLADPAWDMLLDLYAAELEQRRVSVSSLCIAAAVPGTTALRWIGSMIEARLFERYADPSDRRRAFISLSVTARDGMARYFHAVRRAGLAPA